MGSFWGCLNRGYRGQGAAPTGASEGGRVSHQVMAKIPCFDMSGRVVMQHPAKFVFFDCVLQNLKFDVRVYAAR